MNTLHLSNTSEDIQTASAILSKGGLVAMPTETVYGLAADALNGSAIRTGEVAEAPVGEALLGRVIDPIGRPLDERPLQPEGWLPVERPAPAIMDRRPVDTPLETGILSIDSMIPIGRGQRELIIGDRQTGKTTIALDSILNQKDSGVICVYCAIGQTYNIYCRNTSSKIYFYTY